MINCPNCGYVVPSHQRFCGNCGSEVKPPSPTPAPTIGAPISEGQSTPYAYPQPSGYEMPPLADTRPPVAGRMILVLVVLLFAACCALACGILIGLELSPLLFPSNTPGPTPRVTPTRESMLPILYALGLA